jgi:hypothetical protein
MQDVTMSEVLRDPMIRQMLRADGISLTAFTRLLQNAARNQAELQPDRSGYFSSTTRSGECSVAA